MAEQQQWVIELKSKLENIDSQTELERKKCIYRVPKLIRDLNEEAYTPKLVSFGPYHHGKAHLMPMERHKCQFLADYLKRAGKTLEQVVEAFRPVVQDLMDSYDGLEEPWTDKERFIELMILDGCFLLRMNGKFDPGKAKMWRRYMIRETYMDKRRLENQIPLLVISILIENGGHQVEDTAAFLGELGYVVTARHRSVRGMGQHFLDLAKKSKIGSGGYFYDDDFPVRPAMELFQAGVSFEPSANNRYDNISFTNGVLKLPALYCHSNIEAFLLNVTAYENLHKDTDNETTHFVLFMDNIIDTDKDVALLREKGIISCATGSDGEIASLFNRLSKGLAVLDTTNGDEFNVNKNLEKYCNKRWHKWRANFSQTYLSNPWVFISLLAAFILLLLTILQTTYTIVPYYNKS